MSRHQIAPKNDLKDGELRAVSVGETELVLARAEGHVTAFQAHCPHNGAPLAKGVLSGSRLVCPWHHACFSAQTGDLLEPPALDALVRFEIIHEGDALFVELPGEGDITGRLPELATPGGDDTRVFVVLGAGAAGTTAAQTLREDGFGGRIVLVTHESTPPYDRTLLSKGVLAGQAEPKPLRNGSFYDVHGVELLSQTATQLDPAAQLLRFEGGDTLRYDALLLATGSTPVPLEVPGVELGGIFYLRTLQDSQALAAAAEGTQAVVVGASFIGLECASSLRERGVEVTVITPNTVPFEGLFGREVGEMFRALHEENGVTFVFEGKVARFSGDDRVTHAVLEDGRELPADFVTVGVGVKPNLPEVKGLELSEDGSVSVDRFLQLAGDYGPIYAAGDLARYPDPYSGRPVRVEHWRLAMQHGRAAAHGMAGRERAFGAVPFFWTKQHGLNVRYVGHASNWDEVVIDGDLNAHEFLAYYLEAGELRAVLGAGRDADLCAVEECLRLGALPSAADLRARRVAWPTQLASATS